jgi:hypothetical protein
LSSDEERRKKEEGRRKKEEGRRKKEIKNINWPKKQACQF